MSIRTPQRFLWDTSLPAVLAPSTAENRPKGGGIHRGLAARQKEFERKRDHEHAAVAERNSWGRCVSVILLAPCFLGKDTKDLLF